MKKIYKNNSLNNYIIRIDVNNIKIKMNAN